MTEAHSSRGCVVVIDDSRHRPPARDRDLRARDRRGRSTAGIAHFAEGPISRMRGEAICRNRGRRPVSSRFLRLKSRPDEFRESRSRRGLGWPSSFNSTPCPKSSLSDLFWKRFDCEPIPQTLPCAVFVGNRSPVLGRESRNCEFSGFCARPSRSVVVCRDGRASTPTSVDYGCCSGMGIFGETAEARSPNCASSWCLRPAVDERVRKVCVLSQRVGGCS